MVRKLPCSPDGRLLTVTLKVLVLDPSQSESAPEAIDDTANPCFPADLHWRSRNHPDDHRLLASVQQVPQPPPRQRRRHLARVSLLCKPNPTLMRPRVTYPVSTSSSSGSSNFPSASSTPASSSPSSSPRASYSPSSLSVPWPG